MDINYIFKRGFTGNYAFAYTIRFTYTGDNPKMKGFHIVKNKRSGEWVLRGNGETISSFITVEDLDNLLSKYEVE